MRSLRSGSILALLALSVIGCDPKEPEADATRKAELPAPGTLGPPTPPPLVDPSPTPSLPSTVKAEREAADKKAADPKMDPPK